MCKELTILVAALAVASALPTKQASPQSAQKRSSSDDLQNAATSYQIGGSPGSRYGRHLGYDGYSGYSGSSGYGSYSGSPSSYPLVYNGGLTSGYAGGLSSGYTGGLNSGYTSGYPSEYSSGSSTGYTGGLQSAYTGAYTGYNNGYRGYSQSNRYPYTTGAGYGNAYGRYGGYTASTGYTPYYYYSN
ncbi:keratin-associated protein 6-2-like [Ochlerotatus camptorhynchus]|uniref:keratin-associated protein 6-2-like n=1 Tax=Ochlerotatus camptorhynchus TaxID=644619 RepID=UPI0031DEB739